MSNEKENKPDFFLAALAYCMSKYNMKAIDIAKVTGISRSRVSEIINEKYKPGLKVQTKIAEAFNMTLAGFLALGEKSPRMRDFIPVFPEGVDKLAWVNQITPLLLSLNKTGQEYLEDMLQILLKRQGNNKTD